MNAAPEVPHACLASPPSLPHSSSIRERDTLTHTYRSHPDHDLTFAFKDRLYTYTYKDTHSLSHTHTKHSLIHIQRAPKIYIADFRVPSLPKAFPTRQERSTRPSRRGDLPSFPNHTHQKHIRPIEPWPNLAVLYPSCLSYPLFLSLITAPLKSGAGLPIIGTGLLVAMVS